MVNAAGSTIYASGNEGLYGYKNDIGAKMGYGRTGNPANSTDGGVWFGSGNAAPTEDDFTLEAPLEGISVSYSSSKPLVAYDGNGKGVATASFTVTNNNEAAVTIREIGCFSNIAPTSTAVIPVLMERTVLETPITIQPGAAVLVTYEITFNHG